MSMRESAIRPVPRRRRPIWGIIAMVVVGMVVLFGIGFGVSLLVRGSAAPEADVTATTAPSVAPLPCETTMITPAEVLPVTGRVTVNVLNSTKRAGLARDTANVLSARGMKVKKVGNADEAVFDGVAQLRYGPKGEKAAQLLSYYFPGAELVPIDRAKKVVDVVLGKQFEQVAGEAEIAAELASPSPSASGPGCERPSGAVSSPAAPASGAPIDPTMSPSEDAE